MTEAATHLAKAGGKRFRPMFAILAAQFGPDPGSRDVITAATVVEMIHLATLYHDDVMDEAPMRRGAQSANARWTNSIAILSGDFLFARASRPVSTLGPTRCGSSPRRSPNWSPARCGRPSARPATSTRSTTT